MTTTLQQRHLERPATLVAWVAAPALITCAMAQQLLGVDENTLQAIIAAGGVDLVQRNGSTLLDKASLREFWEIYWELPAYLAA
jgi:hypothetical protein